MIRLGYMLTLDNDTCAALTSISERIPCFMWEEDGTIIIECREADAVYVECILAPYV